MSRQGVLTVLAFLLVFAGWVAPVRGQFAIWQGVLASGAGAMSKPTFCLQSTLGQGGVGDAGSPGYRVQTGFWYGWGLVSAVRPWESSLPTRWELWQNYPNPFNPTTTIGFALPWPSEVRLEVYNVAGQRVATLMDGTVAAGCHAVAFDGGMLAGGVYFYRLAARQGGPGGASYQSIKRMVLLK